ncbi:MAG: Stk1 family PASTA domain-containing Ser/Thr kinase [Coriobacteriales bacterium]|jgi:serine/threonine protein kinase
MQIERGTVFGHRYVVQSQIGTGGMATVYRGLDQTLDRLVAIKVMLERYAQDPSFAARFKQEAQAAAALQSPYIVSVYDWGQEGDTYYIIMEYLRGTDLKTGIRSHGALTPRKVAQIGAQVCQALSVAHAHEIIHRDIKPQNIMIQPNGDAKVMDFGIARSKNSHLTQTNSVLGTAHYVSPEQAQGKELGPTSDLYSLGVVMYEASTGRLPFDGDDAVSVALKQVNEEPVPPNEINPNVDDQLNAIIMKCMMKNPAERFQTADELRRVLNNYIMGRPINLGGTTTTVIPPSARTTTQLPNQTVGTQRMQTLNGVGMQPAVSPSKLHHESGSYASQYPGQGSYTDPNEPTSKNGPSRGAIIGIVVALLVVIVLVIVLVSALRTLGASGETGTTNRAASSVSERAASSAEATTVSVPDLTGKTVSQATSLLTAQGLKLGSQTTESSSTVTKGQIISQTPTAGSTAKSGATVDIVVSSGTDTATLPSNDELKGLSETEATQRLTAAGVTPEHDSSLDAYDDTVPAGSFLTLDPSVINSTTIAKGSTVKYGLSKGVQPATVPSVVGSYYTTAESEISNASLYYADNWVDDSASAGTVISVSPSAGTELDKWSTVTITISSGPKQPEQATVPYVSAGDTLGDAKNAIIAAGLNYYYVNTGSGTTSDSSPVVSISPSGGTSVDYGTTVTIYVNDNTGANTTPTTPTDNGGANADNGGGTEQGGATTTTPADSAGNQG